MSTQVGLSIYKVGRPILVNIYVYLYVYLGICSADQC